MSLRRSLQTFNHAVWAGRNAVRLAKGVGSGVREFRSSIANAKKKLRSIGKPVRKFSSVVSRVKKQTRGQLSDKYLTKSTLPGQARRKKLADQIRNKRNAPLRTRQRQHSREVVAKVKNFTRSFVPATWLAKKNSSVDAVSRRVHRQNMADFLKAARKGPTTAHGPKYAGKVYDLRKKRKYQGPKI